MFILHPLFHKCYTHSLTNHSLLGATLSACLASFSKLYGRVPEDILYKFLCLPWFSMYIIYQYSSVSRVCTFISKYAEGHVQDVLLMRWMSTKVWRPPPTWGWFRLSPNILKDFYTTNIHYFVHFICIKWKLYATNTFERLEGRSIGVNTLGLVTLSCHFRWDNLGAWEYKLRQRSRYFNASCTSHLYIHRPSFLKIAFVFYLKTTLQ